MLKKFAKSAAALLIVLASCSRAPPEESKAIARIVHERTGHSLPQITEEKETEQATHVLLAASPTLEAAIKISLLNNHNIQALFDEVGISQMNLIEAGLLKNPLFVASAGFPLHSGSSISNQISLSQNITDLFAMPLRKKYAATKLRQTELEAADALLQHIQEIKSAYRALQYQIALCSFYAAHEEIAQAAEELAEAQLKAGNINEAAYAAFRQERYQSTQQLREAAMALVLAQEKLNTLMGLCSGPFNQFTPIPLPALPKECRPPEHLEIIALENRLDLQALRLEAEAYAHAAGLDAWWTKTGTEIGIMSGKDSEGIATLGPSVGFQIPLFDTGAIGQEKLRRRLHQSCQKIAARTRTICIEMEAVKKLLEASYEQASFQETVAVPLSEKELALSEKLYNAMAISSFELLRKKRECLMVKQNALKARYDFWRSVMQLENALGKIILVE